jgi:hypothetical protein
MQAHYTVYFQCLFFMCSNKALPCEYLNIHFESPFPMKFESEECLCDNATTKIELSLKVAGLLLFYLSRSRWTTFYAHGLLIKNQRKHRFKPSF